MSADSRCRCSRRFGTWAEAVHHRPGVRPDPDHRPDDWRNLLRQLLSELDPEDLLDPDEALDPDEPLDPGSLARAYTDVCFLSRRLWRLHSTRGPGLHLPLQ